MVILLKSDKSLVITSKSSIFQNENLADKLKIYVPTFYDDHDISNFTATLFYKDGGDQLHIETLSSTESDKENYLKYMLPITTKITQNVGNVELWFGFSYSDPEEHTDIKIHTDSVSFIVEEYDDPEGPIAPTEYTGPYEITPTYEDQVLETANKILDRSMVIKAIPVSREPQETGSGYIVTIG